MSGGELCFDLSGIGLRLRGVPPIVGERLAADWRRFASGPLGTPLLDVEARELPEAAAGPFDPKRIRAEMSPERAAYEMAEGRIEIDSGGAARLGLRASDPGRSYYAFLNLLRAALAWRMPSRGGAFLHAAGLVLDGRAFVLVGPAGSGKSTWAALGEAAGGTALSDDVILLDGDGGRFEALGSPLRSTYPPECGPGRWPVAAVLFPAWGSEPSLAAVGDLEARGRLLANLPFVAEAFPADPRIPAALDAIVARLPLRRLTFAPDPGFAALLRGLEEPGMPAPPPRPIF